MIHAVTHGAIHSLCSCASHMRNMISQHLPRPWKFLFFFQPPHPVPSRQRYPDRESGARLSHSSPPQTCPSFAEALVSKKGFDQKGAVRVMCLRNSGFADDAACCRL